MANVWRFPAPPLLGVTRGGLAFAVRTACASLIALYIAFRMNLDEPKWAAVTVWVVAQSNRGMSVSKSQYRILGTTLGAIAAIVLISLFAQTPELFLLALAGWIGTCTGLATSLRNFRAYAAVLAGYTAAIIGLDAASAPLHAVDIALARFLFVILGIVVEGTLTGIFAPGSLSVDLDDRFHRYADAVSTACVRALRRDPDSASMRTLFAGAIEFDSAAEYATAASYEVRRVAGHLRAAVISALTQLAAVHAVFVHGARGGPIDQGLVEEAASLLSRLRTRSGGGTAEVASLKSRVRLALTTEAVATRGVTTPRLFVLGRLGLAIHAFEEVLARTALAHQTSAPPSRARFSFHHDPALAWNNGIRAFAAVITASMFWIYTAWPSGSAFVTTVGVVCALFSTRANSLSGAAAWLKGGMCAAVAAFLCNFFLYPSGSDFGALACISGFFMIGAGVVMLDARTTSIGSGFALFFWNFTSPNNTARIDDAALLNSVLATLVGIVWGGLAFALLFPSNNVSRNDELHRAVQRDLADLADKPHRWRRDAWVSRTADRLGRQVATEGTHMAPRASLEISSQKLLAAWTMGDSLLSLYGSSSPHPMVRRSVTVVRGRLRRLQFERLAIVCESISCKLLRQATGPRGLTKPELLDSALLLQAISVSAREMLSTAA